MKADPPYSKFLAEKMKSKKNAKTLLMEFSNQLEASTYIIYTHRKSFSAAMEAEFRYSSMSNLYHFEV